MAEELYQPQTPDPWVQGLASFLKGFATTFGMAKQREVEQKEKAIELEKERYLGAAKAGLIKKKQKPVDREAISAISKVPISPTEKLTQEIPVGTFPTGKEGEYYERAPETEAEKAKRKGGKPDYRTTKQGSEDYAETRASSIAGRAYGTLGAAGKWAITGEKIARHNRFKAKVKYRVLMQKYISNRLVTGKTSSERIKNADKLIESSFPQEYSIMKDANLFTEKEHFSMKPGEWATKLADKKKEKAKLGKPGKAKSMKEVRARKKANAILNQYGIKR